MGDTHASDPPVGKAGPSAAPGAVAELYRLHFAGLAAFIRRKFGAGPPEPEDAAQAAFERFIALPDQGAVENPKAFLYRCARNYVIDFRRRQGVSARATADIVALNPTGASADGDPSRVLEARQELAAVMAAINALEARRRDVLILNALDGLSCAEIARRMGVSPTRVVQLYGQALAACAKALAGEGPP